LPTQSKKTLIALSLEEKNLAKLGRNIQNIQIISAQSLNVKDLLGSPLLLLTQKGVAQIEKTYGAKQNSHIPKDS
jgi:ribosomal protein L4